MSLTLAMWIGGFAKMTQQGVDKEVGNAAQSKYIKKKVGHEEVEI